MERSDGYDLRVERIEGARLPVGRLHPQRQQAIVRAEETGYLIYRGRSSPWPTFNAWRLLCQARRRPMVRAWARGEERTLVELDVTTSGVVLALDDPAIDRLYELVREYTDDTILWGPWGITAKGVAADQVEALAARLVALARGPVDGR